MYYTTSKQRNENSYSILLLVMAAMMWSIGGLLIKLVDWNPLAIAGMRSAIASIVLLFFLKKPKLTWSKVQIGAAIAYVGTVILFVSANKMTTAANAILLQFTAPIYVALFSSWLLKEIIRIFDWIIIIVVMGGMSLFFFDHLSVTGMWGNIVAIGSGVCFAFFTIFMRMQKDGSPLESVFLGNVLTAIIGLPFMFKGGGPDTSGWLGLLLLGVVQLGIPYILYSRAIKYVTALEAILIPIIEPLLNPIWVFLLLDETPGIWAFTGGLIVLAAITIRCIISVREARNNRRNYHSQPPV